MINEVINLPEDPKSLNDQELQDLYNNIVDYHNIIIEEMQIRKHKKLMRFVEGMLE